VKLDFCNFIENLIIFKEFVLSVVFQYTYYYIVVKQTIIIEIDKIYEMIKYNIINMYLHKHVIYKQIKLTFMFLPLTINKMVIINSIYNYVV